VSDKLKQKDLLCLVTDCKLCGERSVEQVVRLAISGGVNIVQHRDKHASTRELLQTGKRLKSILSAHQIPLIINDRIDVALALDADGVHLGQSDMPYDVARKILGNKKIIGVSINSLEQFKLIKSNQVDYLGVGPIFLTRTKTDAGRPWLIDDLKKLRKISEHVLIGIGGIDSSNIGTVVELGFEGVAVVSAICAAKDPRQAAAQLLKIMKQPKK
jgi:thiamine-phosphate pyrophosphorylase